MNIPCYTFGQLILAIILISISFSMVLPKDVASYIIAPINLTLIVLWAYRKYISHSCVYVDGYFKNQDE